MDITLTKKQVEQLSSLFKEGVSVTEEIELITDHSSGIGINLYARYVALDRTIKQLDITDYGKW